jgi:hypothetical protein
MWMFNGRRHRYAHSPTIHPKVGNRAAFNIYSEEIFGEKAGPGHIYPASYPPSVTDVPAPTNSCVTAEDGPA